MQSLFSEPDFLCQYRPLASEMLLQLKNIELKGQLQNTDSYYLLSQKNIAMFPQVTSAIIVITKQITIDKINVYEVYENAYCSRLR